MRTRRKSDCCVEPVLLMFVTADINVIRVDVDSFKDDVLQSAHDILWSSHQWSFSVHVDYVFHCTTQIKQYTTGDGIVSPYFAQSNFRDCVDAECNAVEVCCFCLLDT